MMYTIRRGDTLIKIAKRFQIDDYKKIWDHENQKFFKKYWPLGERTTETQLPVGQGLYIPFQKPLPDVAKEGGSNKYVSSVEFWGDLHLKISYFDGLDKYLWKTTPFEEDQEKSYKYGQKSGITWYQMFSASRDRSTPLPAYTYYNASSGEYREAATSRDQFSTQGAGHTVEYPQLGYYGELEGNRQNCYPMENGCVYIFRGNSANGPFELSATYVVKAGGYQPVTITESDDSYNTTAGPAKNYIEIKDFFLDIHDINQYKFNYVYTSDIPLAAKTIFEGDNALINTIHRIGTQLIQNPWELSFSRSIKKHGPPLQEEYYKSEESMPVISSKVYNHLIEEIDGKSGINLIVPNAFHEAKKRNEDYQKKLAVFVEWRDDKERSDKSFLYGIIKYLLKEGGLSGSQVDVHGSIKKYEKEHSQNYKEKYLPFHFASLELVLFLDDPRFFQLLINYSDRFEHPHNQAKDYEEIFASFLRDVFENIELSPAGLKYLEELWASKNSYIHQLLYNNQVVKDEATQVKPDNSWLGAFRKDAKLVCGIIDKFFPMMVKGLSRQNKAKAIDLIGKYTGGTHRPVLDIMNVEDKQLPGNKAQRRFRTKQEKKLLKEFKLFDTRFAKNTKNVTSGFLTGLEVLNAYLVTEAAFIDGELTPTEARDLLGAYFGLASSVQSLPFAFTEKLAASTAGKFISGGSIIFCLIYAHIFQENMENVFKSDKPALVFGNGALVVASMLSFTSLTLKVGATALFAEMGIIAAAASPIGWAGAIIAAIGLAVLMFVDSDFEIWAENSIFGKKGNYNASQKEIDRQIQKIGELLIKFELGRSGFRQFIGVSEGYETRLHMIVKIDRLISRDAILSLQDVLITPKIGKRKKIERLELPLSDFEEVYGDRYSPDYRTEYDHQWFRADLYINMKEDGSRKIDSLNIYIEFKETTHYASGDISLQVKNTDIQNLLPKGEKFEFKYSTRFFIQS